MNKTAIRERRIEDLAQELQLSETVKYELLGYALDHNIDFQIFLEQIAHSWAIRQDLDQEAP